MQQRSFRLNQTERDPWEHGLELYRKRNLIERAFNRLMHRRKIATPYDKRRIRFLTAFYVVASII